MKLFASKKAHGPVDMVSKGILIIVGVLFIKFAFSGISLAPLWLFILGLFLIISQILGFFM
jgi:hypothetical protein